MLGNLLPDSVMRYCWIDIRLVVKTKTRTYERLRKLGLSYFKQCAMKAVKHMPQEKVFLLDSNDNVIGLYATPEENPFNQLCDQLFESLKSQKIEEIRIEMRKYGITIEDLK